jgi:hypothetical protein
VETDERAERAVLSHAEAYRLVEEAQEQRARADAAEARVAALEEAGTAMAEAIAAEDERRQRQSMGRPNAVSEQWRSARVAYGYWRALSIAGEPQP